MAATHRVAVSANAAGVPATLNTSPVIPAANGTAKINTTGLIRMTQTAAVHFAQIARLLMLHRKNPKR